MTLWLSFAGSLEVCQTYKVLIGYGKYSGQYIQRPGELGKLAQIGHFKYLSLAKWKSCGCMHECVCMYGSFLWLL